MSLLRRNSDYDFLRIFKPHLVQWLFSPTCKNRYNKYENNRKKLHHHSSTKHVREIWNLNNCLTLPPMWPPPTPLAIHWRTLLLIYEDLCFINGTLPSPNQDIVMPLLLVNLCLVFARFDLFYLYTLVVFAFLTNFDKLLKHVLKFLHTKFNFFITFQYLQCIGQKIIDNSIYTDLHHYSPTVEWSSPCRY